MEKLRLKIRLKEVINLLDMAHDKLNELTNELVKDISTDEVYTTDDENFVETMDRQLELNKLIGDFDNYYGSI